MSHNIITELASIVGNCYALTAEEDTAPYLMDWRRRYTGKALAVLLPSNTEQVAAIVKLARSTILRSCLKVGILDFVVVLRQITVASK